MIGLEQLGKITGDRNAREILPRPGTVDMQLAVVLDGEQVAMRQEERQAGWVLTHPEAGGENRRRDGMLDQCQGDPLVESAE